MENLIKPVDYANKMGISRQAVYAKIKKGILTSRNVGGKIFIVVNGNVDSVTNISKAKSIESGKRVPKDHNHDNGLERDQKQLLEAKDETIAVLKETVIDLKETNRMITSTLRGEVELLKDAFSEMKMLYSMQLEYKQEHIDIESVDPEEDEQQEWIELNDFFALNRIKKEKKQKKIKKEMKSLLKKGDTRIDIYNGELIFLADSNFDDILKKI